MTKQLLFIQGAGEGAYAEDKKLANNLQKLLNSTYTVRYPKMENESDAPYEIWTDQIKQELATVKNDILLIGHSVGASVLIKFLTETRVDGHIKGIFLIATPYWGNNGGWTYDGYEQLELRKNAHEKLPAHLPLFFYHSNTDEVVPFKHLTLYAKTFPNATIRTIDGGGHQLNNDLSSVAADIKKQFGD